MWDRLEEVLAGNYHGHHRTLETLLTSTFLPYRANRQLFHGINRLAQRRTWHRTVNAWERYSRFELSPELLEAYHSETLDRTMCLLSSLRRSPILFEDPNGNAAFAYVRDHRRALRRLQRRGLPPKQRIHEAAASHAPGAWVTSGGRTG